MKATGYNGAMELRGESVVLTRKLFFGRSKGEKAIALRSITAVQFKKAGMTAGYLQIAFSGSKESKGGLFDAANDENTIMFYRKTQHEFEALRNEIEARRQISPATQNPRATDAASEIAKFAELHKQGLLTDEEFSAKKRQLLGI